MRSPFRTVPVATADVPLTPPRWRVPVVLTLVAALFGLAVWAATGTLADAASPSGLPRIELPSTSGLGVEAAQGRLTELGFSVNVEMRPSEGAPKGIVFGQRPEAGAKVEQGDIVTLLVSDGESGLPLPDVTGRQATDAQVTLVSGGYGVVFVPVASESVPPGEVIAMTPAPGKRVVDGGAVTLAVSSGPAPRKIPALAGRPITEAMIELGRAGLGVGTITKTTDSDQPQGTVLGTDPGPGAEVARDYPVKVTVVGPPPTVRVPYLVGARQASAESTLRSVGLKSQVVTRAVAAGDPNDGKVTAQSVPGGAPLSPGSTVQVTVSTSGNPPPPTAPMAPPTTAPPPPPVTTPPPPPTTAKPAR
jgi:serine/threonine-protein kinase